MIDGSHHTFEKNIEETNVSWNTPMARGVVVEAELGRLAGIEDAVNVTAEDASYTDPDQVEEFVTKTGCDSWPSPSAPATAPTSSNPERNRSSDSTS